MLKRVRQTYVHFMNVGSKLVDEYRREEWKCLASSGENNSS